MKNKVDSKVKKSALIQIVLGIVIVILVILIGGYIFYQSGVTDRVATSAEYYQKLAQECEQKNSKSCCMTSVKRMEETNSREISENGICDYGYKREMLKCIDSFVWCKPLTINETSKEDFYQNLKDNCKKTRTDSNQLSCCLDSVKTMEIVGSTKLFPGGKYEEDGKYDCGKGLERMVLRCPGSYAWCQTSSNPDGEDAIPVPIDEQRIEPNQPENPGPGFDDDGNGPICTMEAKSCGDGTYVGRTGPKCEFEKCTGKTLKFDDKPIDNNNSIQLPNNVVTEKECVLAGGEVFNTLGETDYNGELIGKIEGMDCPCACLKKVTPTIVLPDNVITEKECALKGGEVWNTLGETEYNGELIGKIEGLKCPCACLVRSEGSDKIWVNVNGNMEEFKGNLNDIQTFDDCKKAGFKIRDGDPSSCQTGEPHMTGGKYKTFYNKPMGAGKTCADYHYSTCPGSCVAKCTSSSCGEPDGNGAVACTSDCDGPNSCVEKTFSANVGEQCAPNFPDPIALCGTDGEVIATKFDENGCVVKYGCK